MPPRSPFAALLVPVCILLATPPPYAFAEPPTVVAQTDRRAEIAGLAEQHNWVEIQAIASEVYAAGGTLTGLDLKLAATAAAAVGDLLTYRTRLHALDQEHRTAQTTAELARLARDYAEVAIISYGGDGIALTEEAQSEAVRAVQWANAEISKTGSFHGLLPVGGYNSTHMAFSVPPGGTVVTLPFDPPVRAIAPTCGPCCHGHCQDELGPTLLTPPVVVPEPTQPEKRHRRDKDDGKDGG